MTVHYSFHPLSGRELRVFVPARTPDGAVTVEDTNETRLKIPHWMITPSATRFELSDSPTLGVQALLGLAELYELLCNECPVSDTHAQEELSHAATLADRGGGRK